MSARRAGAVLGSGLLALVLASPALASSPATSTVAEGGTVSYTGTAQPGSNATSECLNAADGDVHDVTFTGPGETGTLTVSITWTPVVDSLTSDLILTVFDSTGAVVGNADGSSTTESVTFGATRGEVYTAEACGFNNVQPQPYSGKVVAEAPVVEDGSGPPAPVFTPTDTTGAPAPVVPEVPLAVLAPLAALAIVGVGYGLRQVRTA